MCVCVCVLNHYTLTCQCIIHFLHVSKPDTCMPNQKIKEPTKKEFDNKTQLSQKNSNVITLAWWLQQKDLPPKTPTTAHLLPRTKVRDHHRPNHMVQNARVSLW